jgi:hypothetical protein
MRVTGVGESACHLAVNGQCQPCRGDSPTRIGQRVRVSVSNSAWPLHRPHGIVGLSKRHRRAPGHMGRVRPRRAALRGRASSGAALPPG